MAKWNELSAPNNNIPPRTVKPYEWDLIKDHEFSKEISNGGVQDKFKENQNKKKN